MPYTFKRYTHPTDPCRNGYAAYDGERYICTVFCTAGGWRILGHEDFACFNTRSDAARMARNLSTARTAEGSHV